MATHAEFRSWYGNYRRYVKGAQANHIRTPCGCSLRTEVSENPGKFLGKFEYSQFGRDVLNTLGDGLTCTRRSGAAALAYDKGDKDKAKRLNGGWMDTHKPRPYDGEYKLRRKFATKRTAGFSALVMVEKAIALDLTVRNMVQLMRGAA